MILPVRKNGGFSLIELSIIVTIIGLLMSAGMQTYRVYITTKVTNDTIQNRDTVKEALARHLFNFNYLPCPAGPMYAPDTAASGKAQYNGVTAPENARCQGWSAASGTCNATSGICKVDGFRKSDCNPSGLPTAKDPVLIGSVPYVDLGIPLASTVDGWGNRMTYAISYYQTQAGPATFNEECGVVNIKTFKRATGLSDPMWSPLLPENRDDGAPTFNVGNNIAGGFMYAVVSHGADGRGAYTYYGDLAKPCVTTNRDGENCNGDAIFLNRGDIQSDSAYSLSPGTDFYDDAFVLKDITKDRDKWERAGMTAIKNKTLGRVGIGGVPDSTVAGDYKLDVYGNMRLEDFQADQICSNDVSGPGWTGPVCFSQSMIGGAIGMDCNGGMMSGIVNGVRRCVQQISMTGLLPGTCPTTPTVQLLKGFDAAGGIICQAP